MHDLASALLARIYLRRIAVVAATAFVLALPTAQGQQFLITAYNTGNSEIASFEAITLAGQALNYGLHPTYDDNGSVFGITFASDNSFYFANSDLGAISQVVGHNVTSADAFGGVDPFGIAFNSTGTLFAADTGDRDIIEYLPSSGVLQAHIFASGSFSPLFIAFGTSGNLYATDSFGNDVISITPAGVVSTFATGLNGPTGLAFDSHGNLFVANSSGNTVSEVTPGGVVSTFATGLSDPYGLVLDAQDNLYVSNLGNSTISKITSGGSGSTFVTGIKATGIAISPVPEPALAAGLGGLLALGAVVWRRRASAKSARA